MFMPHCKRYRGGIAAIRNVVSKPGTGGFERLVEMGCLHLTVEKAIVLNPNWTHLFSDNLPKIAQRKVDGLSRYLPS